MTTRVYGERKMERLLGINSRTVEVMAAVAVGVLVVHWMFVMGFVLSRIGSLRFLRLHYTAALGVDWVDAWWMIFMFPLFGLAAFFVNALLSGALSFKYRSSAIVIMSMTVFMEVLAAMGGVMALLLNG